MVAANRFSQDEIEERNRGFLDFRECLIGRGWIIPQPAPGENGLLFSDYIAAARDWNAPAGESIVDTDDFVDCGESGDPFGGSGGLEGDGEGDDE